MMDARWLQLRKILVCSGWVWREDTLVSPRETMWFTQSREHADTASFRARMSEAARMTEDDADAIDQTALHEDLVSLVAALDVILDGN